MKKKVLLVALLSVLGFLGLFVNISEVYADTPNVPVKTSYVLFDNLSQEQKDSIIKEKPNQLIVHDTEQFQLIYKKVTDKTTIPEIPTSKTPESKAAVASEKKLPDTGESKKMIYVVFGMVLLLAAIVLLIWKKKYIKTLLILGILSFGIGATNVVSAAESLLPKGYENLLIKNYSTYAPDVEVNGYEYVGYIHTYTDLEPLKEKGKIVVHYQDEDGNSIADDVTLTGLIDSDYSAEVKEIANYTFKEAKGNQTGKFTKDDQAVTLIYKKVISEHKLILKNDAETYFLDGFEKPYYYTISYYDTANNLINTDEVHESFIDFSALNKEYTMNTNDQILVYSRAVFNVYVENTKEKVEYYDFELKADDPSLTQGVMPDRDVTINYSLYASVSS